MEDVHIFQARINININIVQVKLKSRSKLDKSCIFNNTVIFDSFSNSNRNQELRIRMIS